MTRSTLPCAAVLLLAAACGGEAPAASEVTRADSAGVEIVTSGGQDVPLAWRFEPEVTLGGEEAGPESFYQINRAVAADAAGNVYVLDRGNQRVLVFAPDGRHLRSMGRKGSGPGEMEMPGMLSVTPDGAVAVQDAMLHRITRFSADGSTLAPAPVPGGAMIEGAAVLDGELAVLASEFHPEHGTTQRLSLLGETDTTVLAEVQNPPGNPQRFRSCPVQLPGFPPIFSPALVWSAAGERLAFSRGPAYDVRVVDGARAVRSIRRGVEPAVATPALAARAVPRGELKIRFGGGECRIPAEEVVEVQGHAPVVPTIARVALAPDGAVWVLRNVPGEARPPVDVFAADGAYLGTLPAGSPFPDAFLPDGRILHVDEDELGVQRVVLSRVVTG